MKERILSSLVVFCMVLTLMPIAAHAAANLDVSTGNVVISSSGDYIITGTTTTNTIKVNSGVTGVNITLNNVSVDVSAIANVCAFDVGDGASVNVTLADGTTNTFKSGSTKAGIKVEAPTTGAAGSIVISGTGTLIVIGGGSGLDSNNLYAGSGAGIGSNGSNEYNGLIITPSAAAGNITINGGTIQATGGETTMYSGSGAGIGGGGNYLVPNACASNDGIITIHDGNITAVSGSTHGGISGAGIGGGAGYNCGDAGTILIDGGSVNARSADGLYVGSGIGIGGSIVGLYSMRTTSITITGTAKVDASNPDDEMQVSNVIGYASEIKIGGNAVLNAYFGRQTVSPFLDAAVNCDTLNITDIPAITIVSPNKKGDIAGNNNQVIPIRANNVTSSLPIISGLLTAPISTTDATDIAISGGNSQNAKIITLPADYASFATTVGSIGSYTGTTDTSVLQDSDTSTYNFNLTNGINNYNIKAVLRIDQGAPTETLAGVAPTTYGGSDGKITGTTTAMEYKLSTAAVYTKVTGSEITGLAAGTYNVRYAAKTGFNAGTPVNVVVPAYISPVITVDGSAIDGNGQSYPIPVQVINEGDGTKTVEVKSTDAVVIRQADGTKSIFADPLKLGFSVQTTSGSTQSVKIAILADGTIQIKGLANNTETKFAITYNLENGKSIIIGFIDVKVDNNGNVTFTSNLIDPYGIITDTSTGKVISGVNVTLYYADTARNRAAGKIPGTVVELPAIDAFKPNNNKNPQVSDAAGAYAFMVYPTSDYYIIAAKDGYNKYISSTISVGNEIVKWNFQMTPVTSNTIPKTGSIINIDGMIILGGVFMITGIMFIIRKREDYMNS